MQHTQLSQKWLRSMHSFDKHWLSKKSGDAAAKIAKSHNWLELLDLERQRWFCRYSGILTQHHHHAMSELHAIQDAQDRSGDRKHWLKAKAVASLRYACLQPDQDMCDPSTVWQCTSLGKQRLVDHMQVHGSTVQTSTSKLWR